MTKDNLRKREFYLAGVSRGMRVHGGSPAQRHGSNQQAQQQERDAESAHLEPQTGNRKRALGMVPVFLSIQVRPSVTPPSAKPHLLFLP